MRSADLEFPGSMDPKKPLYTTAPCARNFALPLPYCEVSFAPDGARVIELNRNPNHPEGLRIGYANLLLWHGLCSPVFARAMQMRSFLINKNLCFYYWLRRSLGKTLALDIAKPIEKVILIFGRETMP